LEKVRKVRKERLYLEERGYEKRWSLLRFVLDILILKYKYGWSDRSFNDLLTLLAVVLPKPNVVPTNMYQTKKLISPLTTGVERIHACRNHSLPEQENPDGFYFSCHFSRNCQEPQKLLLIPKNRQEWFGTVLSVHICPQENQKLSGMTRCLLTVEFRPTGFLPRRASHKKKNWQRAFTSWSTVTWVPHRT
jgi:hypothetical protein